MVPFLLPKRSLLRVYGLVGKYIFNQQLATFGISELLVPITCKFHTFQSGKSIKPKILKLKQLKTFFTLFLLVAINHSAFSQTILRSTSTNPDPDLIRSQNIKECKGFMDSYLDGKIISKNLSSHTLYNKNGFIISELDLVFHPSSENETDSLYSYYSYNQQGLIDTTIYESYYYFTYNDSKTKWIYSHEYNLNDQVILEKEFSIDSLGHLVFQGLISYHYVEKRLRAKTNFQGDTITEYKTFENSILEWDSTKSLIAQHFDSYSIKYGNFNEKLVKYGKKYVYYYNENGKIYRKENLKNSQGEIKNYVLYY